MKKTIIIGWFILIWVSVASLLGCASIPIKPLSKTDISDLKGRWRGEEQCFGQGSQQIKMEIFNDNLDGELIGKKVHPFTGKIENGKLVIFWDNNSWVNLRFYKGDDKIKLEGDYQSGNCVGILSFYKVK